MTVHVPHDHMVIADLRPPLHSPKIFLVILMSLQKVEWIKSTCFVYQYPRDGILVQLSVK